MKSLLLPNRHWKRHLAGLALLAACSVPAVGESAHAAIINSTEQGYYESNGGLTTTRYTVDGDLRHFFTFDLSSIAGQTVIGGVLTILPGNDGIYGTTDLEETYYVFDYTLDIADLGLEPNHSIDLRSQIRFRSSERSLGGSDGTSFLAKRRCMGGDRPVLAKEPARCAAG